MDESSIFSNGIVQGMEDYQMGEHLWNFLTKEESKATYNNEEGDYEAGIDAYLCNDFENMVDYNEAEIEDCVDNDYVVAVAESDDDEVENYMDTRFQIEDFQDMTADGSRAVVPDDSYVEVPRDKPTYYSYANAPNPPKNDDYEHKFIRATRRGDLDVMEKIGRAHPNTLVMTVFRRKGTALHHTLWYGEDRAEIAKCLVKLMTPKGLETQDKEGYTPLARAVYLHRDRDLLSCMIEKNKDLPKIGESYRVPVVVASWKRFADTTKFLYPLTDEKILSADYENPYDPGPDRGLGTVGINLLNQCISLNLFGIAGDLLKSSPTFLRRKDGRDIYPTHALAKAMAALQISNIQHKKSSGWDHMLSNFVDYIGNCWGYILLGDRKASSYNQEPIRISEADKLLRLIIRVRDFHIDVDHSDYIADAMIEAAKHGIIKFIIEMLKVDRELISIKKDGKNIFWHAIMNRQEEVFNLIYTLDQKDMLLSFNLDDKGNKMERGSKERNNILHFAAKLPPSSVLDRISGPVLQMQRELQWFKAVQDVTTPRYREETNETGQTPYVLFVESHKDLLEEVGESMKKMAIAASTISGLIVTIMFAASFTVINDTYQIQTSGLSHDMIVFFIFFLISAAVSLCLCTASIMVFFGILTSQHSHEYLLSSLPRKLMRGCCLVFVAYTTMMLAFCCALYIMLKGRMLHLFLIPIFVFSLLPIVIILRYISPLLWRIYKSTNKHIFDKSIS